jgi:aklavinone 12-hydroxylase
MMMTEWKDAPADERTQVLVIGAGLAGLSTAAFLARRGIDVLVVEKHPGTSPHPRAVGQTPRTMELLSTAGVADAVRAAGAGLGGGLTIKIAESVHGQVFHTILEDLKDVDTSRMSPAPWCMATQDKVEPILAEQAEKSGARTRFSTEVVDVAQDADGVSVRLLDRWTERLTTVRADYLVAADGHRSPTRERLDIPRTGPGALSNVVGVLFEANLTKPLKDRTMSLYYLRNPHFTAAFGGTTEENRYIFACEYHPERGESVRDFPPERITELLRIALDEPELAPHILSVQPWEMAARIADKFRDGRIFLAGDAVKVTPPTGGMGGNTAVCDGFDLAWKLAAVCRGEAGPGLLDSYEAERKPFAEQVVNTSLHNAKARMAPDLDLSGRPEPIDQLGIWFGLRAISGATLIPPGDTDLVEDPADPSGRPGFRAPHLWLERGGDRVSTVDLFGADWVLFTGTEGGLWHQAATATARELGISVAAYGLGPDLVDPTGGEFESRYGLAGGGASLVRPDGVVAWHTDTEPADPAATLLSVLRRLLDR